MSSGIRQCSAPFTTPPQINRGCRTHEDETGEKFREYNVTTIISASSGWRPTDTFTRPETRHDLDGQIDPFAASSIGFLRPTISTSGGQDQDAGALSKKLGGPLGGDGPNNTEALVADVYRTAWGVRLQGVTVYRDDCRDGVLLEELKQKKCEGSIGGQKSPKVDPGPTSCVSRMAQGTGCFIGLGRPSPRVNPEGTRCSFPESERASSSGPQGGLACRFPIYRPLIATNTIGGISRPFQPRVLEPRKTSGIAPGMPIEGRMLIESLHLDSEVNQYLEDELPALVIYRLVAL